MTCVSKQYEIKAKMIHEQWRQLKMEFLLSYNLTQTWVITFSSWGGTPSILQVGKTLDIKYKQ